MKIIVCGAEEYQNSQLLTKTLRDYTKRHKVSVIVIGQAQGAETLTAEWAMQNSIRLSIVPSNRLMQGVEATIDRISRIIETHRDAAAVLHFKGSANSEDLCQRALRCNIAVDDVVVA